MRIPYLTLLTIVLLNMAVDWCIFRYLCKVSRSRLLAKVQLWSAIILTIGLLSFFVLPVSTTSDAWLRILMWIIFIYISIYVPKYIFVMFYGISRIPELWKSRRLKGVAGAGAIIALLLCVVLWWGAIFNRYNIDVTQVDVPITNLPKGFNNFKIAQISDLHLGTYGNDTAFVSELVERINSLSPDMIVFTGDIVNRRTTELDPFIGVLSELKAPYGVYSILGNHDYGDYYTWHDSTAYKHNNELLARYEKKMGWQLLKNEHRYITHAGDTLVIIGVENIGDPPFHVYGNLSTAYPTPEDGYTKILLSHNPAHWVKNIADSDDNISLTLSGHTHAMQISILGWSPAVMRYCTWGGLYNDNEEKHYLYVNRGVGTVGFPARIGASPEITLLTLKSKSPDIKSGDTHASLRIVQHSSI